MAKRKPKAKAKPKKAITRKRPATRRASTKADPKDKKKPARSGSGTGSGSGTNKAPKKKPPARTVKPRGRQPAKWRRPASQKVSEFATPVKRRAAASAQNKKQGPAKPDRAALPKGSAQDKKKKPVRSGTGTGTGTGKARKPSKHPEAIRARRYRAERRAIEEAEQAQAERQREHKRIRDRERRRRKKTPTAPASRELGELWLERIRDHFARVTPTTLDYAGNPNVEIDPAKPDRAAWLITGHLQFEPLSYLELGEVIDDLLGDHILAAWIHPQRLCRILILFNDPNDRRGSAGARLSKISGWEFALGDLHGELVGGGPDNEENLAARYDETLVSEAFFSFSATIVPYFTAFPTGPRTATLRL